MPAALCYVHTGNRKERVERLPGRYEINYIRQIFAKRLNKKFLLLSTVLPSHWGAGYKYNIHNFECRWRDDTDSFNDDRRLSKKWYNHIYVFIYGCYYDVHHDSWIIAVCSVSVMLLNGNPNDQHNSNSKKGTRPCVWMGNMKKKKEEKKGERNWVKKKRHSNRRKEKRENTISTTMSAMCIL